MESLIRKQPRLGRSPEAMCSTWTSRGAMRNRLLGKMKDGKQHRKGKELKIGIQMWDINWEDRGSNRHSDYLRFGYPRLSETKWHGMGNKKKADTINWRGMEVKSVKME